MPGHYGGGMNTMSTTMSRTTNRANTTARATTAVTSRRGRMNNRNMNGTAARGVMRTAGQFGRGGVRRGGVPTRPTPITRRGRTTPIRATIQGRGVRNPGLGNHGFRGVDGRGNNI